MNGRTEPQLEKFQMPVNLGYISNNSGQEYFQRPESPW